MNRPTTDGSVSNITLLGTYFPFAHSSKNVVFPDKSKFFLFFLRIFPSNLTSCSRQKSSHSVSPIWFPHWPRWTLMMPRDKSVAYDSKIRLCNKVLDITTKSFSKTRLQTALLLGNSVISRTFFWICKILCGLQGYKFWPSLEWAVEREGNRHNNLVNKGCRSKHRLAIELVWWLLKECHLTSTTIKGRVIYTFFKV